MAKNVVILGCGRSGTKLVQLLVSRALLGNGLPISFYYEPLLWKSHTVKKIADDGVKIHKQMPLFWDRKSISESGRYVRFFGQFLSTKKYSVVTKFIRMVGRFSFLRETFPDAYIVFVFRNPL
jgi:hypothetical protein